MSTDAAALAAPRQPRYRSLDLWRGAACLLVVLFHAGGVAFLTAEAKGGPGVDPAGLLLRATRIGWVGVPFFFVISGYAITATADTFRRRSSGTLTYFRRRIRRIYPPYWAMLGLQVAIVFAVDVALSPHLLTSSIAPIAQPWTLTPGQWLGNLTLTESWRATVLPLRSDQQYILGQAWTLCYEEQFYLVTGLSLLLRPQWFFRLAAGVTAVTLLGQAAGLRVPGLFLDGYWLAFAAGILVYWQVNYGTSRSAMATWLLLGAIVVDAVVGLPEGTDLARDVAAAGLFAMALLAGHRFDDRLANARALRPLAFAGTICYSLYLSHAVIVRSLSQWLQDAGLTSDLATVVVVVPVSVAAAVAVGWAFHVLVERHFLNRPASPSPSGLASGAGVSPSLARPDAV